MMLKCCNHFVSGVCASLSEVKQFAGYKRPGVHQGHHWSLLIYVNQEGQECGFYSFDSFPGEEHHKLATEAASYFAPLIPG